MTSSNSFSEHQIQQRTQANEQYKEIQFQDFQSITPIKNQHA
jgi:hypothetical protein